MLTTNVKFKNFEKSKEKKELVNIFRDIKNNINKKSDLFLNSLTKNYKYSFNKNNLKKYKKFSVFTLVGMGGSSLGAKAIYSFLKLKTRVFFFLIVRFFVLPDHWKILRALLS